MGWRDDLAAVREELDEVRTTVAVVHQTLSNPAAGLSALHADVDQTRMKLLETVSGGTTGLREENRELRRRQEKMLSDLADVRREVQALVLRLEAVLPGSRPAVPAGQDAQPAPEAPETEDTEREEAARTVPPGSGAPGPGPVSPGSLAGDDAPPALPAAGAAEGQPTSPAPQEETPVPDTPRPDHATTPEARAQRWQAVKAAAEKAYHAETGDGEDGVPDGGVQAGPDPAAVPEATGPVPEGAGDVAHGVLLLKAAAVSSATVVCHRDTWEFLTDQAAGHPHFRTPSQVQDTGQGRIEADVSGRSLIAVLITLWDTRHRPATAVGGDWALAATLYHRIGSELQRVRPGTARRTTRIVLDDGTAADGISSQDGSAGGNLNGHAVDSGPAEPAEPRTSTPRAAARRGSRPARGAA
ncbi:hypothetical protein RKE29_24725 [Streptomyces sp. B1866]|uniref:hypothetical protein n=1 Tax=Streptomyces sp. B1866 TaxID=3075431 RepID=UPI002890B73D|nr:hypothetical protein [Streptomyces sp. B1866]MDT3399803.1 hypothetical protein [Streptomyces sp. B1866]